MPRAFSWLLQLPPFRALYRAARKDDGRPFSSRALAVLRIEVVAALSDLVRLPRTGAAVIVANHPRGLADGLALLDLVRRVRPDVRVLTNYLVSAVSDLRDECVFIDPFGGRRASARNRSGLRRATRWLESGGTLIVFPSGEVAPRIGTDGMPVDGPWLPSAAKLASRVDAPIVPVYISGRNSQLFYRAGGLHPLLRTVLLPIELLRQVRSTVTVRVGNPLASARDDAASCTAAVRSAVDKLAAAGAAIVAPVPAPRMATEIRSLPSDALLLESGDYQVWCARAVDIPCTLREIGRLREVTFRGVGEGTGQAIDLDAFDEWYEHLFVWNAAREELVGAYRVGRSDEIARVRGVAGLYTHTLFEYDARLLARMSPALELGRSFVRAEYQRSSNALLLLWRGIGSLIARNPQYRFLFGPVSISNRYRDSSQRMLMAFLQQNHYNRELGELVRALNPVPDRESPGGTDAEVAGNIADVDRLIAATERDGKGMPVLLRQYLRLNAMLLGFNVDPQFGDVLDALMMVDLTRVDPAILARYVGRETAKALRAARRLRAPRFGVASVRPAFALRASAPQACDPPSRPTLRRASVRSA